MPSADGRYTRCVGSFTLHTAPLDFRSLCRRVLTTKTRYLLLDLDRTTHRGLNLGEQLGWEIAAYKFFGPELLALPDAPRFHGRLINDPRAPRRFPAYVLDSARRWAFPGLSYLIWGKLAARHAFLDRWSHRRFGSEPMRAVQRIPQTALLHELATLPKRVVRELAQRVWDISAPAQTIEHADLQWVRERCPDIRIILTSASPQPMVEVAGDALGVDGIEYSCTTDLGDRYASPYWVDRRFALGKIETIAAPSEVRINSGHAKIERLLERYPDLLDADVESVGISDTGYGEDHAWAHYFSVVVDVNSSAPFPPLVAHDAPLRAVHSARLMTHSERQSGAKACPLDVELRAGEMQPLLAQVEQRVEQLCRRSELTAASIAPAHELLEGELVRVRVSISELVQRYNSAWSERPRLLAALRQRLRNEARVQRRLSALERPDSMLRCEISEALREARAALGRAAEAKLHQRTSQRALVGAP